MHKTGRRPHLCIYSTEELIFYIEKLGDLWTVRDDVCVSIVLEETIQVDVMHDKPER